MNTSARLRELDSEQLTALIDQAQRAQAELDKLAQLDQHTTHAKQPDLRLKSAQAPLEGYLTHLTNMRIRKDTVGR